MNYFQFLAKKNIIFFGHLYSILNFNQIKRNKLKKESKI